MTRNALAKTVRHFLVTLESSKPGNIQLKRIQLSNLLIMANPYRKETSRTDGNSKLRNSKLSSNRNQFQKEVKVTTTAGTDKIDIPWETIQAAQEADSTLQEVRELLWNPNSPQDVNEFGIDVVQSWSQRKFLEIIKWSDTSELRNS